MIRLNGKSQPNFKDLQTLKTWCVAGVRLGCLFLAHTISVHNLTFNIYCAYFLGIFVPSRSVISAIKPFLFAIVVGIIFICFSSKNAHSATCTPVTGGADATISADCEQLVLDAAGAVTISTGTTVSGNLAILNSTNSSTTSLTINGIISSSNSEYSIYIQSGSSFGRITNSGTISSGGSFGGTAIGLAIEYQSRTTSITDFINSGTISVGNGAIGISNSGGVISSFQNSGTISTGRSNPTIPYAIGNELDGLISTLTNIGTISTGTGGTAIYNNASTITTLNNQQGVGNSSGALTYKGVLPTNYNIIINSPTQYGQLSGTSVTGSANFGIYSTSTLTRTTYTQVLSGLADSNVGTTRTGKYNGFTWNLQLQSGSLTVWDLIVTGASTADTQQSLVNTASVLQGTFTLQNSVMVNGFTYDCPVFDKNGVCISVGGRNTTVQAQGINNTNGLLIASYRLNKNNTRIGAWVDQNLSMSGPGTVQLNNSTPMIGIFGVWSQRPDGVGAEVKVSAAYGQKDLTVTRQIVGTSEAGSGGSQLISQGAQVVGKYGFAVMPDVVVSPYAGVRYTQNNMGEYTEATSSAVTAPLTYSALNTNATTALAGAEARYRGIPKTTLFASAGVETDTNTANGSYSATGVDGLTPVNFNPNSVKTRPTATVGGYYDITKSQRIGVTGIYRQEPFQAVSTTTVLATYTIGL